VLDFNTYYDEVLKNIDINKLTFNNKICK